MACSNRQCVVKTPHVPGPACRFDGADVFGKVTGLGREAVMGIWEEVKANAAKLEACPGPHAFERIEGRPTPRYACRLCSGEVTGTDKAWYERGLAHARSAATGSAPRE